MDRAKVSDSLRHALDHAPEINGRRNARAWSGDDTYEATEFGGEVRVCYAGHRPAGALDDELEEEPAGLTWQPMGERDIA